MILGLGLSFGPWHDASSQTLNSNGTGVRHAIVATVEADQDNEAEKRGAEPRIVNLDVTIRIVDYANDSRFFGVVDGKFPDFDRNRGAQPQQIWADRKCHQNRGLPRIWVLAIDGKITEGEKGEKVFDIAARPRQVGVSVPQDEIVTQRDRHVELNDPNRDLLTLAKTTESRLNVRLDLKSVVCPLGGD